MTHAFRCWRRRQLPALDHWCLPAIAMRVGVPYFTGATPNSKAVMALLRHLEHATVVRPITPAGADGVGVGAAPRRGGRPATSRRLLLPQLEARFDREAENRIPPPDELASECEEFLRRRRDEPPES